MNFTSITLDSGISSTSRFLCSLDMALSNSELGEADVGKRSLENIWKYLENFGFLEIRS